MGFFGMRVKPGQKEAVEVPPGWCLQLCTAALETPKSSKPQDISATLWVQVEGEIGDTSYLLGSLQGGGPCAQIQVGHCLTSVDGEVIIQAEGKGVIHLTGFFNREYDPDLEQDEFSDEDSEEDSDEDLDEAAALMAMRLEEEEDEDDTGFAREDGNVKGKGKKSQTALTKNGRAIRSAAAAALACGNASSDTNSEDDSEVDGDYVPGHDGDDDDDDDDDDNDNSDDDEAEQKAGSKRGSKSAKEGAPTGAPPAKKAKADEEEEGGKAQRAEGEEGPEMTKQERKRQRKRANKRKAAEAKRGLEEAFSAMDADDKEPPVGIPLKNPRTKTLKGGLKIKDTTFGGGKVAMPGRNVKVCYEGCFPDGRVFDKNQNRRRPLQFRLGVQQVIVGMDRGVEGMRVGGSREIAIPAALGYGARGTGPIPANQDLVFRVELIDVLGK